MVQRLRLSLSGLVQGVGFRPYVHNLAASLNLTGLVRNSPGGALVEVEGPEPLLHHFHQRLHRDLPAPAFILAEEASWLEPAGYSAFVIEKSAAGGGTEAAILPDLAPCSDCLAEFSDPAQRRYLYPFINCTRCGPRYSIIDALPYDRPNTTMSSFDMCAKCSAEYADSGDRRFHAQPIACPACGPALSVTVASIANELQHGRIVALKGIGGFQLLCDASNDTAVRRLRERKRREWKPLAVLAASLDDVRHLAFSTAAEERVLSSGAAPIVLLAARDATLAPSVRNGSPWLGVMLPASPLHVALTRAFPRPLVCTSGNLSDEPIATANDEARDRLSDVADAFLDHNRPIARPCDDSVTRVILGRESILRRARGYAPLPVWIGGTLPRILAVGGHLKNSIALAIGPQIVVSQHIGDLDTPEARDAFHRAIGDLCRLYRFSPDLIACDLHPDYYSTVWARQQNKPVLAFQHHVAHAASCAAENDLRETFLAAAWDGTGLGLDGTIWGGEFFLCAGAEFTRVAHLRSFWIPGGDAAMKDCRRPAAGLLHALGQETPYSGILEKRINCFETTSVGRLFDALAALGGFADTNRYEGEAGLLMEAAARRSRTRIAYPMPNGDWGALVEQYRANPSPLRFHLALANWIVEAARRHGVKQVALSGGCFQNALLTELAAAKLERLGIRTAIHQRVPANDGGLSLGQAYLAARA
jgi:hydrogenase maturation protein HypF